MVFTGYQGHSSPSCGMAVAVFDHDFDPVFEEGKEHEALGDCNEMPGRQSEQMARR